MYLSSVHYNPGNDGLSSILAKRWIGRRPCDPPRFLDVAKMPYGIHRTVFQQELHRPAPLRIESFNQTKLRETSSFRKDFSKLKNNPNRIPSATNTLIRNNLSRNSRRADDKLVDLTVKCEKITPISHFSNGTTSTLTAWQKYWKSNHAERRRRGLHESEPAFYMPNVKVPTPVQTLPEPTGTHVRIFTPSDVNSNSTTPSRLPSSCTIGAFSSDNETGRRTLSSESIDEIGQVQSEEFLQSNETSTNEMTATFSKTKITIPTGSSDDDHEKFLQNENSMILSSRLSKYRSDSQLIQEVATAQKAPNTLELMFQEIPSPVGKKKKKISESELRPKPIVRKLHRSSSPTRRARPLTSEKVNVFKSESIVCRKPLNSPPKSKYNRKNWQQPYIGYRHDPPPPPTTPARLILPDETDYNQESLFESFYVPESILNDSKWKTYEFL